MEFRYSFALFWLLWHSIAAIQVNFDDPASIKSAASTAAYGMMKYYKGNESGQIPGLLPQPYYWWECGGMFMCMIDYWSVTGDSTYNDVVSQGMLFQIGPHDDYMPPNETFTLGNDDQAFWAMAALIAAETNFPNPTGPDAPSWLALAQAVFNEQVGRWDTSTCAGGLHWQVFRENAGYPLKNTISNGCLFQIGARLARYTRDDMYAQWSEKLWDWMVHVGLIDTDNWNIYDNAEAMVHNCTQLDRHQWTYNAGTILIGAATMYNYTSDPIWANRTQNILNTIAFDFFPDGIMKDICEEYNACNNDEQSFKAYLSRWMAATTQMAPFTLSQISGLLRSSAVAAAQQCDGGTDGVTCGLKWYQNSTWDGSYGVGQQMAAMEVFLGTLIHQQPPPLTNTTGGTSVGNPSAGYNASNVPPGSYIAPPSKGERVGAWFITALLVVGTVGSCAFMWGDTFEKNNEGTGKVGGEKGEKGKGKEKEVVVSGAGIGGMKVLPPIEERPVPPRPIYLGGSLPT